MTKTDLTDAIVNKVGFSKKDSCQAVELIFEVMKKEIEDGKSVKIHGLGTFTVKEKKERNGRNPQTGQSLDISARKVLKFSLSNKLKRSMNGQNFHK